VVSLEERTAMSTEYCINFKTIPIIFAMYFGQHSIISSDYSAF
jgi:hypothetical protein